MKNKIKKISVVFSALILSVVSLSSIVLPQIAHATGGTGTYYEWTGAASGTAGLNGCTSNCWSVPGNWNISTDGGTTYAAATTAPNSTDNGGLGDNLVFDASIITSYTSSVIVNDISNLTVDSITFQAQNNNNIFYTINGDNISLNNGITTVLPSPNTNYSNFINSNLILLKSQTFSGGSYSSFYTSSTPLSITIGTNTLTLTNNANVSASLSGTGSVILDSSSSINPLGDSSSWSGTINATDGSANSIYIDPAGKLGASASFTLSGKATIGVDSPNGFNLSNNLNLGAGATILTTDGSQVSGVTAFDSAQDLTLSGTITLTGSAFVNTAGTVTISGAITGTGYTLSPTQGMLGSLNIVSSNNNSATQNGTSTSQTQTISVASGDNQPNTVVTVGDLQTEIIDGIRGDVTVNNGGILKGNGIVGSISVNSGGIVAPGHSPGCLTTTDNTGLNIYGTYQVYIVGTTQCSQYSSLIVNNGPVYLVQDSRLTGTSDATLAVSILSGYSPHVGDSFTIINNVANSPVIGTFVNMPEGSTFVANGITFKITYKGGNGNSVVLTVMNYPGYVAPKTPDTGFGLISNNSSTSTIILTAVVSVSLIFIARYYTKSTSKK